VADTDQLEGPRTPSSDGGRSTPRPEADPRVGRVLGGAYRLLRRIGEGGMGVVYEARHETLGRGFAVKLLRAPRLGTAPDALARFRQEAVRASQLEHDHIVDVVHFDRTEDDEVFLVMELLRGESLAARIRRTGALPEDDALRIAHQVADALQAAHETGLVHRDLKPENVFLTQKRGTDVAKVLDFGIAKFRDPDDAGDGDPGNLTATGALMGTPLYISPEQARGEVDRVDRRADVYALGAMLYEMVTGSPPFEGANHYQLLWKHGQEPPVAPSRRVSGGSISDELEAAILRALAKDPDERFPTMAAFADAMPPPPPGPTPSSFGSASASSPSIPSSPAGEDRSSDVRYGWRRFARELTAVAALAVALVTGAVLLGRGGQRPSVTDDGDPGGSAPEASEAAAPLPPEPTPSEAGTTATRGDAETPGPRVPVRFESRPPGAEVWVGDQALGRTPLVAPVPRSERPIPVRFVLEGYEDGVVRVIPAPGARVDANLDRRRRPAGASPRPPADPLPFKKQF